MSKKIISMFLVFVMVVGLFPTSVFASTGVSTLTTDIDGAEITAGEWYEFNFTLNAKAEDAGKRVVGVSSFSNDEAIEAIEYWDGAADGGDGGWVDMTRDGDGNFGAAEGFEMPAVDYSANSKFRVMFKESTVPGEYSFNVQMKVVDGTTVTDEVLCETTATFMIKTPVTDSDDKDGSTLTTSIDGAEIKAGEWYEFDFTLHAKATDAGKMVVGVSEFSDEEIIEALEYWETATSEWKNLLGGDGTFGPASGFPMPNADVDATSKFRVKFKEDTKNDTYSFNVKMVVVENGEPSEDVLCEAEAFFEVEELIKTSIHTNIDSARIPVNQWFEFYFGLHGGEKDTGKMVIATSQFSNEDIIEALEYWEGDKETGEWKNLLGGDGTFGPSSGFPVPPVGVDAESKFRVKFKEDATLGEYSFTVKLKDVADDSVLAETEAIFEVYDPNVVVEHSVLSIDIDEEITVGEWAEVVFNVDTTTDDIGRTFYGVYYFSNEEIVDYIEYWDVNAAEWVPFNGNTFAENAGILISAEETLNAKFRVKFNESAVLESYSFQAQIRDVEDDSIISSTEAFFTLVGNNGGNIEDEDHSTVSTSIDGAEITAGEWFEFDFTLHAKSADAGTMVVGVSTFSDTNIIEALEYWEGDATTGEWKDLLTDGDGAFGPSTGFPMPDTDVDATSKFRVKFKEDATPGEYSFTAGMKVVDTEEILCDTTATFEVKAPVVEDEDHSTLTTDIDGDEIEVNRWHEFSFTLNAKAADAGKKVVGVSTFSNSDIIEALEYWEGDDTTGEWKNLLIDGDGNFGAAEGFEMPAINFSATSKFRVKFKGDATPGEYSFTVQMKVVDGTTVTDEVLCETTATFEVMSTHVHIADTSKWEKDDDGHWHGVLCEHDVITDYAEHTSSGWIIDREATTTQKGLKHKECTVCGHVITTAEIPVIVPTVVNVIIRTEDTTLKVNGSLYAGVVSISLTNTHFKKLIGKNIDTGIFEIDISDVSRAVTGVEMTKSNLKTILNGTEDYNVNGLQITMKDAKVKFDAKALEAIVDQAKGSEVEFSIDEISKSSLTSKQRNAIKDMDVLGVYSATITSGSRDISDFDDGFATILVDDEILGNKSFKGLVAYHVSANGKLEEVDVDYRDYIEIVVPHFSEYVLGFNKEEVKHECPKDKTCPLHKYKDLLTDGWYHDGVHYALEEGLMVGYSSNMFGPNDAITRGQLVTVLWRMENSPAVKYNMSFKDVKSDAYYANAVKWAQATGLVAGYSADSFGPDDAITREQMATIMQRYAQYKKFDVSVEKTTTLKNFNDANQVSDWALGAMKWAVEEGLIVGSANNLMPSNSTTRAQVSTILMRFCEAYCK